MAELWMDAQPAVLPFILASMPRIHDAEDLLQQVAVDVATNFELDDESRPFVAWAVGIARNKLRAHFRKQGSDRLVFTLIELLVVVAIIIALLAVLMPSIGRTLKIANRTVCASNLSQAGVANMGYASDNFNLVMRTNHRPGPYPFDIRKECNREGYWFIENVRQYTPAWEVTGYSEIDGIGISMCPDVDAERMNRYFAERNAGSNF